jgi:hypothetical protein
MPYLFVTFCAKSQRIDPRVRAPIVQCPTLHACLFRRLACWGAGRGCTHEVGDAFCQYTQMMGLYHAFQQEHRVRMGVSAKI